jgi:hypothetical protein
MIQTETYANLRGNFPIADTLGLRGAKFLYDQCLEKESPSSASFSNTLSSLSAFRDLFKSNSDNQEFSIERKWDKNTLLIEDFKKQLPDLESVSLACSDTWSSTNKVSLASFLLNDCRLILKSGPTNEKTHNLNDIATTNIATKILNTISAGRTLKDLISEFKPALQKGTLAFQETGGSSFIKFHSKLQTSDPAILSFFSPQETQFSPVSELTLESSCSIVQNAGEQQIETCTHSLTDPSSDSIKVYGDLYVQQTGDKFYLESSNRETLSQWKETLDNKGLWTEKVTPQKNGGRFMLTGNTSFMAHVLPNAPRINGTLKSTDFLSSLLIPIGIGIAFAGAHYAKTTFDHKKKTMIRKIAGVVAGIMTASIGIALTSIPFGTFEKS